MSDASDDRATDSMLIALAVVGGLGIVTALVYMVMGWTWPIRL